ncbi:MAG: hypothetical protein Q9226_005580 [Calogaya cf. arnoldii]
MSAQASRHGLGGQDPRVLIITAVLVISNLAVSIHRSSRVYLFQQSLCLQHYLATDPQKVGLDWLVEESLCKVKQVQSSLSIIEGVDAFLQLLPGRSSSSLFLKTDQGLLPLLGLRRCLLINVALSGCGILLSALFSGNALLSAIILFALPIVRKVYLEPKLKDQQIDLLVVKASLLLNAVGMAGFGIPMSSPLFILALMVYTSGNGLYDSLTTFGLTSLTAEQGPADFLVRCGLVQTLAGLVAAPFWSTLFSLCLKSDILSTGLPYWISAGLFGGTLVLARSLHGQGIYNPLN